MGFLAPSSSSSSSSSSPPSSPSSSATTLTTTGTTLNQKSISVSMLSGMGAGVLCTILCAPLDVVKVRMQIQGGLKVHKYEGNIASMLRGIYREEGIRGIFRGVGPALCTIPLFWGVYWPMYDYSKAYLAEYHEDSIPEVHRHLYSAIFAGVISDVITNPFWVTRTRIQTMILHPEEHFVSSTPPIHQHDTTITSGSTQQSHKQFGPSAVIHRTVDAIKNVRATIAESPRLNHTVYTTVTTYEMMKRIYQKEGFWAFYKGLGASFLGLSHVAIQFPLYEYLKKMARERDGSSKESLQDLIMSSMAAKLVASTITYPHEVLRSRLQDVRSTGKEGIIKRKHPGLFRIAKDIIDNEGVAALWSGLRVNLFRIVPATVATFVSYEYISRYLKNSPVFQ